MKFSSDKKILDNINFTLLLLINHINHYKYLSFVLKNKKGDHQKYQKYVNKLLYFKTQVLNKGRLVFYEKLETVC